MYSIGLIKNAYSYFVVHVFVAIGFVQDQFLHSSESTKTIAVFDVMALCVLYLCIDWPSMAYSLVAHEYVVLHETTCIHMWMDYC